MQPATKTVLVLFGGIILVSVVVNGIVGQPPSNSSRASSYGQSSTSVLPYSIVNQDDISIPGKTRKVIRVQLRDWKIPTEPEIVELAKKVNQNALSFDEVTVFVYLSKQDPNWASYGVVEFEDGQFSSSKVQSYVLDLLPNDGQ